LEAQLFPPSVTSCPKISPVAQRGTKIHSLKNLTI
jgi:hypothetical protein